ncbi:MAG: hypothetical protein LOD88_02230 [Novibacillus thermophilus]
MNTLKNIFLVLTIVAQLATIVCAFVNVSVTFTFLGIFALSLAMLFGLLIKERRREKEEENQHDDRHY